MITNKKTSGKHRICTIAISGGEQNNHYNIIYQLPQLILDEQMLMTTECKYHKKDENNITKINTIKSWRKMSTPM